MNKVRKIKHSLTKNEESETATTTTTTKPATKTKLLTPCRRVGLNRKRKNILSGSCSSSELNISSPNVSLTEIDISVKDHDDSSNPSITNTSKIELDTPVLTNPPKPRKNRLGASRKRPQTVPKKHDLTPTLEELTKKYNICDVSVLLSRCDVDKYIINRNTEPPIDISAQIENEAISSTPELQETHPESSEIQTNQISTTIEDLTPIVDHQKNHDEVQSSSPNKSAPSSAKIKDLFGDSDDSDFDFTRKKRKRFSAKPPPTNNSTSNSPHLDSGSQKNKTKVKKSSKREESSKKTDSQNDSDEIPENTIPRKKRKRSSSHNKKSPKRNRLSTAKYNSDSDDDFMEKPRREKKDPDIKKKINIPVPDPLNRTEHIRIRENKSYTIMHMNNISSYVKYYDNDVNLKRTESDDNQQTSSQPVVSNVRTSMILERKDYLANKGSQESDQNKPSDSQDSPALEPVSVSENSALETISVGENNTALEVVSVNPDETTNNTALEVVSVNPDEATNDSTENSTEIENPDSNETETPDSNDTESPDSNDTLPDNIPNVETPKTVRYYERPDFDIPENDFETTGISNFEATGISNFEVVNNSNFETTDNSNFETTTDNRCMETPDNSFLETTDIRSTIFETTDSSNFETTTFDVRNFSTTPSGENIEETPEKSSDGGCPQNEVKNLLQLKNDLINEIKIKRDKLDSLKRIMAYKQEHNLEDLRKTTLQFKYTLQEALVDLLSHLKTHTERNFNMGLLLGFLKIPNEMVGYSEEKMCFE